METVWKDYIHDSKAKHIAIIAHSYGGVCTVKFVSILCNKIPIFTEIFFIVLYLFSNILNDMSHFPGHESR